MGSDFAAFVRSILDAIRRRWNPASAKEDAVPDHAYFLGIADMIERRPQLGSMLTHRGRVEVNNACIRDGRTPLFDIRTPTEIVEELLQCREQ